jgi:selenophosphate synthase
MYYLVELFNNQSLNRLVKIRTSIDLMDYISEADKVVVFSTVICTKIFGISIQTKSENDALMFAKLLEYASKKNNKLNDIIVDLLIKIHYNKFLQITEKINNTNA